MALENEYMLEELTAEEIYQKKLTAGANITINPITNEISSTGGGSSVQYTSNYAQGDILGTLNIDGASSAIRTPNLVEGENISITRNQQAGTITISSSAGSGDLSAHELTEEAYNALTPAEKANGELYLTHPATVGSSDPNKIYYNDTLYGTEGGNDVVELTQAEWDALPSSKLTDGIIYVITDGGGGGGGAISELTDVELTDLADKEILEWDAVAEKWKNVANSGGGGTGGSSVYTCDLLIDQTIKAVGNYNFSKNISEYDAVVIAGDAWRQSSSSDNKSMGITMFIPKEDYLTRYVQDGWGFAFTYQSQRTTFNIDVTNNCLEVGYVDVASNPAYINKVYGLKFGTLSPVIYSEEEREVGVARNNKPLYQKTWVLTVPNQSGAVDFPSGESELEEVEWNTWSVRGQGQQTETPWYTTASIYFDSQSAGHIYFYFAGNYFAGQEIIYTAQYTKTTDVAGSGSYNTLGVPTVHYDTTEQVIGTFLGKPLYQKIFDWSSSPVNIPSTWSATTIDSSNIERVIECKGHHSDGTFYTTDADPTGNSHTKLKMRNNGGGGTYSYVTLQYTKIND